MATKSRNVTAPAAAPAKRRGRPATGVSPILSVRLPDDLYARLIARCAADERSRTGVVVEAIAAWLDGDRVPSQS